MFLPFNHGKLSVTLAHLFNSESRYREETTAFAWQSFAHNQVQLRQIHLMLPAYYKQWVEAKA